MSTCPRCAGLSLTQRIELAAYCGDEGAAATGALQDLDAIGRATSGDLANWTRGLQRWGPHVAVRAAVAAARAAFPEHCRAHYGRPLVPRPGFFGGPTRLSFDATQPGHEVTVLENAAGAAACYVALRSIEAAEAWLACCPCEEHLIAWRRAFVRGANDVTAWVPMPEPSQPSIRVGEIQHAARLVGEPAVRAAIQRALIAWALDRPDQPGARAAFPGLRWGEIAAAWGELTALYNSGPRGEIYTRLHAIRFRCDECGEVTHSYQQEGGVRRCSACREAVKA